MTRLVFTKTFSFDHRAYEVYTVSSKPRPLTYTGTLLPAVIHTFDFQVDIEEAETLKLTLLAQSLEQSIASIVAQGNRACSSLEPERPELIKELKSLTTKLRSLHAKLLDLDTDLTLEGPDAEEPPQAQISDEDKAKFKAAAQEVKTLHRKIMALTHEERYGKNPILRELFDMANTARKNNDASTLAELLSAAKKYHQSASDR
jgi:chromosome segregation ATPase